jgi:hypothetical protein
VFTARYGLIPYMKHVTFRRLKVNMSWSDQVQEDKIGGACATRRDKTRKQRYGGKNLKEINHLEYLGETWLMLMRWEGWLSEGFVNTGMNLRVGQDVGNFLTSWETTQGKLCWVEFSIIYFHLHRNDLQKIQGFARNFVSDTSWFYTK